jgi:TPR repeat protein
MERCLRRGFGVAKHALGLCYLDGVGVQHNDKTGVEWMLRAAKGAAADSELSKEASWILANCYTQGRGVEVNEEAAAEYLLTVGMHTFDMQLNLSY